MSEPVSFDQGKKNKLDKDFLKGYHERGNKIRSMDQDTADKFGMSIESKPSATMGRLSFKTPEHRKAFDDHMRGVYAKERDAAGRTERNAEASHRRQGFKVYGSGHEMKHHGEGKPHGSKES